MNATMNVGTLLTIEFIYRVDNTLRVWAVAALSDKPVVYHEPNDSKPESLREFRQYIYHHSIEPLT